MLYYLWYWLGYEVEEPKYELYDDEPKSEIIIHSHIDKVITYKNVVDELKTKIKKYYID